MNIKEVEHEVGISADNLRYYEKEGLLSPQRSKTNNYRDYSEEDIDLLKNIKLLRLLGVSVSNIRIIISETGQLQAVLKERLSEIQQEGQRLLEVEKLCQTMITNNLSFFDLQQVEVNENEPIWKGRLSNILLADITKEWLTPSRFNRQFGLLLVYTFFIESIVCFLTYDYFLTNGSIDNFLWLIQLYIFVAFTGGIAVYLTDKWVFHMIVFQIVTFLFIPAFFIFLDVLEFRSVHIYSMVGYICISQAIYALLLLIVYKIKKSLWKELPFLLVISTSYGVAAGICISLLTGEYIGSIGLTMVLTWYITGRWKQTICRTTQYNKYYLMKSLTNTVNLVALIISGAGNANSWRRDGRTFK